MVLGLIHLVREPVEAAGQLPALAVDLPQAIADLGQGLIDVVALGDVLTIEQRLRSVERVPHPARGRTEASPPRRCRMQPRHVAVGPHTIDERLHHFPKHRRGRPGTQRPRRPRRCDLDRFGRRLQRAATAAQRRRRFNV
ncbi:hypothetical protein WU83_16945 [Mycobacterium nebraskense]|nr:hypothetical protein WU83_16945 [Mycobacterium nebraskense]